MKKKILGGIAVLAIAAVAAWNVNYGSKMKGMSDLSLANVEALAQEESDTPNTSNISNKCEKKVTTDKDEYEVIDGKEYLCHITKIDCIGTGITICFSSYSKDCI